jgi:hypothetical protein
LREREGGREVERQRGREVERERELPLYSMDVLGWRLYV